MLGGMGAGANGQGAWCRTPVANGEDRSARSDRMIASHKPADVTWGSDKGSTRFGKFLGFGAGCAGTFGAEDKSVSGVFGEGDVEGVAMIALMEEGKHGPQGRGWETWEMREAGGGVRPARTDQAEVPAL